MRTSVTLLMATLFFVLLTGVMPALADAPGNPPTIGQIPDQIMTVNDLPLTLPLSVTPCNAGDTLTVWAGDVSGLLSVELSADYSTLTITPLPDSTGMDTVTLGAYETDAAGEQSPIAMASFTVTVNALPGLPTIEQIANQTMTENDPPLSLPLTITPFNTSDTLTVEAKASSGLLSTDVIANDTLVLTPTPDTTGTTTVTLSAYETDTAGHCGPTATSSFTVTLTSLQDPPLTIEQIPDQVMNENDPPLTLPINITKFDDDDQPYMTVDLTYYGIINLTFNAQSMTIFTLGPGVTGREIVTVKAWNMDNPNFWDTPTLMSFSVTVNPVPDGPPTIGQIANQTMNIGDPALTLPLTVTPFDSDDILTVTASTTNGIVTADVSPDQHSLLITPTNTLGTDTVTVSAFGSDADGASPTATMSFTVLAGTAPSGVPTIEQIADQTLNENDPPLTLPLRITPFDATDILHVTAHTDTTFLQVSLSPDQQSLTLAPLTDVYGVNVVEVDAYETNNFGDGPSGSMSFSVTVNPVPDSPLTIGQIPDQAMNMNDPPLTLPLSITPLDSDDTLFCWAYSYQGIVSAQVSPDHQSLIITPAPNTMGMDTVGVNAQVWDAYSVAYATMTFNVQVGTAPTAAPTIAQVADFSLKEADPRYDNWYILQLHITPTDPHDSISWTASSSVFFLWPQDDQKLSILRYPGRSGVVPVTIQAYEYNTIGAGPTASMTFNVTVIQVPESQPFLAQVPDILLPMNAPPLDVPLTIIPTDFNGTVSLVSVTSDNHALLPDPTYNNFVLTTAGIILTLAPRAAQSGTATVTVTIHNWYNAWGPNVSMSFAVRVGNALGGAPTITQIPDQEINENDPPRTLPLLVTPFTASGNLHVEASAYLHYVMVSLNPDYSSLTIAPAPGAYGQDFVEVNAYSIDGNGREPMASMFFAVLVHYPADDTPTITPIADQKMAKNGPPLTLPLTVTPYDADDTLTVWAKDATGLVMVTLSPDYHQLTLTPAPDATGTDTITISASSTDVDGQGPTATSSFTVTVNAAPDGPPTITQIPDQSMNENDPPLVLPLTITKSFAGDFYCVTVYSYDSGLLTAAVSPDAQSLILTPQPEITGITQVMVSAYDFNEYGDGPWANMLFSVTVNALPDGPPTIAPIPDQVMNENDPPLTIPLTVTPFDADDALTLGVTTTGNVVTATANLAQGLTLTPITEATGTGTVTVSAYGTDDDGDGPVALMTFNITVNFVKDALPTIGDINDLKVAMNSGSHVLTVDGITWADDDDVVTLTATSDNPAVVPDPAVSYTSQSPTGTLTCTPVADAIGTAHITVTVTASAGTPDEGSASVTFAITVVGKPTATKQWLAVKHDTPLKLTLSGTDPQGYPLRYVIAEHPAHGSLTGFAPLLTFTPAPGYVGVDHFTFTASNGYAVADPATVYITMVGVPAAIGNTLSTPPNTPVAVTLSGTDPIGFPLTAYILKSSPVHGTLTYAATGQPAAPGNLTGLPPALVYTPAVRFRGVDTFTFAVSNGFCTSSDATVNITVYGKPNAIGNTVMTNQGTPVTLTLTGTDPLGLAITGYTLATMPAHGTLTYTATGLPASGALSSPALTYTPAAGFHDVDTLTFTVTNAQGLTSAPATVSITVYGKPNAGFNTVTTNQGTPLAITLSGSDPLGLPLTGYTLVTLPAHGTLTNQLTGLPVAVGPLLGLPPVLVYTPNPGFHDVDSFTFTVTNGYLTSNPATVSITVWGRPTAYAKTAATGPGTPVNVTLTGTDPLGLPIIGYTLATMPAHGTLTDTATGLPVSGTVTNPNLTYTPAPGFSGAVDTFTYTVSNGHMDSKPATVSLTVYGKPTAGTTTLTTNQETPLPLTLTGSDRFGLPLSNYTLVTPPAHGTLTYTATGQPVTTGLLTSRNLTYTPAVGFHDVDKFTFTTSNGYLTSDPATVSITVFGKPTARAQALTTSGGMPISLTLTGSDPLGLPLTAYTLATLPAHGTLTYTATGLPVSLGTLTSPALTFTPAPGYTGPDAFTFTVSNGHLTSNPATVSLTVN